jgi:ZF-HD class homeobox domain-containing protein
MDLEVSHKVHNSDHLPPPNTNMPIAATFAGLHEELANKLHQKLLSSGLGGPNINGNTTPTTTIPTMQPPSTESETPRPQLVVAEPAAKHHQNSPPKPPQAVIRYRECNKNHAAHTGSHAIDGCGEFMPGGAEGTDEALKCAACNCHRNFHRREVEGESYTTTTCEDCRGQTLIHRKSGGLQEVNRSRGSAGVHQVASPGGVINPTLIKPHHQLLPGNIPSSAQILMSRVTHPQPAAYMMSTTPGDHSDEYRGDGSPGGLNLQSGGTGSPASGSAMKKRFRTKFTTEQKDRMCAFSEKVGWRIQKHDEAAVHEFCAEVGVKRHVLKVWMHNNKNTLGGGKTTTPSIEG